ncbi:MAG: peptidyl-prolyl cis-trans isomerase [Proteobacteria bacterium]|nr:peptidyl-prolyl cis-trans isomerase [Pseudomonadota bacterium]
MLINMRKLGGKWVLGGLMGLIIASFAFFGIGDVIRNIATRSVSAIAVVGDVEIAGSEVRREFNRQVSRLQPLFGNQLDSARAREIGLVDEALSAIVVRILYDLEGKRLGLDISEATLRDTIRESEAFRNQQGQFDANFFASFLASQQLSEAGYLSILRNDLKRKQLSDGVSAATKAPDFMVDLLYRHAQERRIGEYAVIGNSTITGLTEPTESEISDYHLANAQRYTAPEYRQLTYIHITPEDLFEEFDISDSELEDEYDDRQREFMRPERRTLEQIVAPDESRAREISDALAAGREFIDVALDMTSVEAADVALGSVTVGDLFGDLADVVFALGEGQISAPVQSAFGWHIFRVTAIEEASSPPLSEVREQLVRDISLRRATDALYDFANRLDDKFAAGATIEEAAGDLSLKVIRIASVDRDGRDTAGNSLDGLPAGGDFLSTAFSTAAGQTSLLGQAADGSEYVLRVDRIIEPALRPLDGLRQEVRQALIAESRDAAAAARINTGGSFAAVVAELGLTPSRSEAVRRDGNGRGADLSNELVAALFAMDPDAATDNAAAGVTRDGDGHAVIRLVETIPAEPRDDADGIDAQRNALRNGIARDLIDQYRGYLETRFPVTVNRGALDAMF